MLKTSFGRGRLASKVATTAVAAFAAALILAPTPALAVQYHDVGDGDVEISTESGSCEGHVITGTSDSGSFWDQHHINVDGGTHTITLDNVTINTPGATSSAMNVRGNANVTLVLKGQSTLDGAGDHPGIWVESGSSLTITSDSSENVLTAIGGGGASTGAAGIGGGYNDDGFGDITIEGGHVVARGGGGGAGIGGGYMLPSGAQSGNVTITGGFVEAFGGSSPLGLTVGAGIGAGENGDLNGTVTISGGVVYAEAGSSSAVSIGGGHSIFGESGNGTFTTGSNGNGVIVAPNGIGNATNAGSWDGIFVSYSGSEDTATLNSDGSVTLNGSDAQVWGNPSLDYDLTINSGATLQVIPDDRGIGTPTLTIQDGAVLTNNNRIVVGANSALELYGYKADCAGNGTLSVDSTGHVRVPLSSDLVTVGNEELVYNANEQSPSVAIRITNLWGYSRNFVEGTDYTLDTENARDAKNGYALKVTPVAGGDLLNGTYDAGTFDIAPSEDWQITVPDTWTVVEGEAQLLDKLPSFENGRVNVSVGPSVNSANDNGDGLRRGTISWTTEDGSEVNDASLQNMTDGEKVVLNWTFTHQDANFTPMTKSGTTTIAISNRPVANVSFTDIQNYAVNATYGDEGITISPLISVDTINNGTPFEPPAGSVTYAVMSGNEVVSVGSDGKLTYNNAGTAVVRVSVAQGNDAGTEYSAAEALVTVVVAPKPVNVDTAKTQVTPRTYDGTTDVTVTSALEDGAIINGDDAKLVATGELDRPSAGTRNVAISYKLEGVDAGNYILSPKTDQATVEIDKANIDDLGLDVNDGAFDVLNHVARLYSYSFAGLLPTLPEGMTLGGQATYTLGTPSIQRTGYFEASDLKTTAGALSVSVPNVESDYEGVIAEIPVTISSANFEDMTAVITVNAVNPLTHAITATAGEGGTISPNGTVNVIDGESAVFTFTPDEGYKVSEVLVDGQAVEATDSYTFTGVTENHTIEVTFEKTEPTTPAHEHVWSDWQHDGYDHWKECTECGKVSEQGKHTYGDWVNLNKTDDQGRNLWEHTCSVCGYVQYGTTTGDSADVTPIDGEGIPSAGDPTSLAPIAIAGAAGISALLARRRL